MAKIHKHPVLTHASDIKAICRPLDTLDISYFAHVNVDQVGKFSAVSNHPHFHKHYLDHSYHHADIHLADIGLATNYVIWDALEYSGDTYQMKLDAQEFNLLHTFTIINRDISGNNFYHFASHIKPNSFNQVYLSNLDLLNKFIEYFNDSIGQSSILSKSYQFKYSITENNAEYTHIANNDIARRVFYKQITQQTFRSSRDFVIHAKTKQPISISAQQSKCLTLLIKGYTSKQIADQLRLSYRTVNHYLEILRIKLGCTTGKELIAVYHSQIVKFSGK